MLDFILNLGGASGLLGFSDENVKPYGIIDKCNISTKCYDICNFHIRSYPIPIIPKAIQSSSLLYSHKVIFM